MVSEILRAGRVPLLCETVRHSGRLVGNVVEDIEVVAFAHSQRESNTLNWDNEGLVGSANIKFNLSPVRILSYTCRPSHSPLSPSPPGSLSPASSHRCLGEHTEPQRRGKDVNIRLRQEKDPKETAEPGEHFGEKVPV